MTSTDRRRASAACVALGFGALGCGAASAPSPVAPIAGPAPAPALRYTRIELGTQRGHAARTTFVLTLEGERAVLTETYDRDDRSLTLEQADRDPAWRLAGSHTYRGTRRARGEAPSQEIDLELTAPDAQPLSLRCAPRPETIAPAAAALRADPASAPCAARRWQPAPTASTVLVCGAAGIDLADADADDQLVFSPSPGVEWIDEHDGCAERFGGLRFAR